MTTEVDIVSSLTVSDEHFFLNKGKVTFLQIKQDTIWQKCCQKHKTR